MVTLLDRRKEKRTPLALSVDLRTAGVGAPGNVTLVTLDGQSRLPAPKQDGSRIVVAVPVYKGRVAAVLIDTGKAK